MPGNGNGQPVAELAAHETPAKASTTPMVIDLADVREAVDGALVVVVTTPAGRYRRRVYLSLRAAEAAVDRAERRGQVARIVLCSLLPVRVIGGE